MKRIHLLAVEADAAAEFFSPLFRAAEPLGLRLGWLDLSGAGAVPPPLLAAATDLGAFRAVAVGADGRVVTAQRLAGPAVLRDLVRRQFLGAALVLVRGAGARGAELSRLAPSPGPGEDGWTVAGPDGAVCRFATADELARALRRPRPWGSGESGAGS